MRIYLDDCVRAPTARSTVRKSCRKPSRWGIEREPERFNARVPAHRHTPSQKSDACRLVFGEFESLEREIGRRLEAVWRSFEQRLTASIPWSVSHNWCIAAGDGSNLPLKMKPGFSVICDGLPFFIGLSRGWMFLILNKEEGCLACWMRYKLFRRLKR